MAAAFLAAFLTSSRRRPGSLAYDFALRSARANASLLKAAFRCVRGGVVLLAPPDFFFFTATIKAVSCLAEKRFVVATCAETCDPEDRGAAPLEINFLSR